MAPDAAFEAWLAERVDFAATSLLGLTLRPTFDAGWNARAAAPAAGGGDAAISRLVDAALAKESDDYVYCKEDRRDHTCEACLAKEREYDQAVTAVRNLRAARATPRTDAGEAR